MLDQYDGEEGSRNQIENEKERYLGKDGSSEFDEVWVDVGCVVGGHDGSQDMRQSIQPLSTVIRHLTPTRHRHTYSEMLREVGDGVTWGLLEHRE